MSGAGKEIADSVRKNHEMVMEVRANFESKLQQAEKKLEELSLSLEERLREAELLRVDLELETPRAKRDEMKLAQACRNAVENSDLLPVLAVGPMRFLRKISLTTCGATNSVQSVSCTTSVPSSGNDVRTSSTRQS